MKKTIIAALAATSGLIAMPAAAQDATGTVNVNGSVNARCTAIGGISGTINVGELADATTGFVRGSFASTQRQNFTIRCTSGTVGLKVEALPLLSAPAQVSGYTPTTGYTARVNYTATLTAIPATGTDNVTVSDTSDATGFNSGNSGSVKAVGQRLSNVANNVYLDIASPTAEANKILEADASYAGSVLITVSPTV